MRKAWLTIDDVPSGGFPAKVRYLAARGIPAVFFCVGAQIPGNEAALREALRMGFVLGNHSLTHPHFSDIPPEACEREVRETDALLEAIHEAEGVPRKKRYFRFPYFDAGDDDSGAAYEARMRGPEGGRFRPFRHPRALRVQGLLAELGYRQPRFPGLERAGRPWLFPGIDLRCSFDPAEYMLGQGGGPGGPWTAADILAGIDARFPGADGDSSDIILVHDHAETEGLFPRIIDAFLERGLRFEAAE